MGEEGSRLRRIGVQVIETQPSSVPAGTRPQIEAGRSEEWFEEMMEDGQNKEGSTRRGLQGY